MAKPSSSATSQSNGRKRPSTTSDQRSKVQVFTCPSDFPPLYSASSSSSASRPAKRARPAESADNSGFPKKKTSLLDWNSTAKEIHALGSNGFVGKKKREFEDDAYKRLTGRERKHHKVPLPIVRGIQKKAAERRARELEEARQAGIVLPNEEKDKKRTKDVARIHGPVPSVGFMNKGILRVHKSK